MAISEDSFGCHTGGSRGDAQRPTMHKTARPTENNRFQTRLVEILAWWPVSPASLPAVRWRHLVALRDTAAAAGRTRNDPSNVPVVIPTAAAVAIACSRAGWRDVLSDNSKRHVHTNWLLRMDASDTELPILRSAFSNSKAVSHSPDAQGVAQTPLCLSPPCSSPAQNPPWPPPHSQ